MYIKYTSQSFSTLIVGNIEFIRLLLSYQAITLLDILPYDLQLCISF